MGVYKMNKFLNLHISGATPKKYFLSFWLTLTLNITAFLMVTFFLLFLLVGCE
jgi:hypothetical protein